MSKQEFTHPEEVVDAISNVIPQLTQGDHLVAQLFTSSKDLRFATESERHFSDLLRASGSAESPYGVMSYDLRLFGTRKEKWTGLDFIISTPLFPNRILSAWHGGAVDSKANSVYINIIGDTDLSFNFDTQTLGIGSMHPSTWELEYKFDESGTVTLGDRGVVYTREGLVLSQPDVGADVVSILIQRPSNKQTLALVVPKQITRVDLNALPEIPGWTGYGTPE